MRLYIKLGLLALVMWGTQHALMSSSGREAYFALRCYVAAHSCDNELENRLVAECERSFAASLNDPAKAVAYNAAAMP
jgi:hypothetical protein